MTWFLLISVTFAVVGVVAPAGNTAVPPPSQASIVLHLQAPHWESAINAALAGAQSR